jgi:enamine deaminase RidA (YjgF/YER057c/UK114 family)
LERCVAKEVFATPELFLEVFGERGAHAHGAFGAAQIPFGSCVEIEIIVEVFDSDSECQV